MAINNKTLAEELAEKNIVGSYVLKPNRFYAKEDGEYVSVDVVTDGTMSEVSSAIREQAVEQIGSIRALGTEKLNAILALETNYSDAKANLIQTYTRMYNYFTRQGLVALATIMATAIVNLNNT